jgi:hypothetical protein
MDAWLARPALSTTRPAPSSPRCTRQSGHQTLHEYERRLSRRQHLAAWPAGANDVNAAWPAYDGAAELALVPCARSSTACCVLQVGPANPFEQLMPGIPVQGSQVLHEHNRPLMETIHRRHLGRHARKRNGSSQQIIIARAAGMHQVAEVVRSSGGKAHQRTLDVVKPTQLPNRDLQATSDQTCVAVRVVRIDAASHTKDKRLCRCRAHC